MKDKIELPKLKQQEIDRIEEVQFYYLMSKTTKILRGAGYDDETILVKALSALTQTNETLMIAAYQTILSLAARPIDLEIAIACKHIGTTYKFTATHIMYNQKLTSLIRYYIDNRQENLLFPKLPEDLTEEVKKFNKHFRKHLSHLFEFLSLENNTKEVDTWD